MILEELLPDIPNLFYSSHQIDKISNSITIELTLISTEGTCPCCSNISCHHHSKYHRKVSDLSWGEFSITLLLSSNKFFCKNETCPQKIFCERLGVAVKKYARKTSRMLERLKDVSLSVGCNPGSRLLNKMSYSVSSSTLLRLLHRIKTEGHKIPKVLGVDDWAYKKGGIYGTILVDLEERRPIDLLPDRTASTLKKWLLAHPGIKIISRDRSGAYAEGAKQGAPKAVQIADRWHLLKNLKEALQKLIEKSSHDVRKTSWYFEGIERKKTLAALMEQKKKRIAEKEKKSSMAKTRYSLIFSEVKKLHGQGLGKQTIAKKLCISKNTVKRYLKHEEFPEKSLPTVKSNSARMHYQQIRELWEKGERSAKKIWEIITAEGHDVSRPSIQYVITKFGEMRTRVPLTPVINWNTRKLGALLLQYQSEMKAKEYRYIKKLCEIQPKIEGARKLSLRFRNMLAKRKGERLRPWIKSCKESGIIELSAYARSIKKDYAAVKAAATYDWSGTPRVTVKWRDRSTS